MLKSNFNASHDFIFAKLHGMWANAAKDDRLDKLIHAENVESLVRMLMEFNLDASKRNAFHRNLIMRDIETLSSIAALLDDGTAGFYRSFIERTYFENVKVLLNYHFFPRRETNISYLLVDIPGVSPVDIPKLTSIKDVEEFLREFPKLHYSEEIDAIVRRLDADRDIIIAECELDKLAYKNKLVAADKVPSGIRSQCKEMIRMAIDIVNLCTLLRNVHTYHLDRDRISEMWIGGGKALSPGKLTELSDCESVLEAVSRLPSEFQNVLLPFYDAELYVSENALWTMLYKRAKQHFSDYNHSDLSIIAFPFLKRFETLNLRRVYEGMHFGIKSSDMHDMMIRS